MNSSDLHLLYSKLLAGRLPAGSGSVYELVFNHVYGLTGQENLHFYAHSHNGFVYYFALESKELQSEAELIIPFTDYLPGAPKHLGEASYVLDDDSQSLSTALVLQGAGLRLISNTTDVVTEMLAEIGLPVFKVPPEGGQPLRSLPQIVMGLSQRFVKWLMGLSLGLLAASLVAFVAIETAKFIMLPADQMQTTERAIEQDLNETLKKLNVQQPLARQIARVQQVSATVVRAGGWVENYHIGKDESEYFEIVLPSWVSQDYLDVMGRDVVTDLRDLQGLLVVRKEEKK